MRLIALVLACALAFPTTLAWAATSYNVNVFWTDGQNEESYRVERTENGGAPVVIASLPADSVSHVDVGVNLNTLYCYTVYLTNTLGEANEPEVCVLGTLPTPGGSVTVTIVPIVDPAP